MIGLKIWRDAFDVTTPQDTIDQYKLGPMKASLFWVRIPVWLGLWLAKVRK